MKKMLFLILVLTVVLTFSLPSFVLAAKPASFVAAGTLGSITPGTVKPIGNSGQWLVINRDIIGELNARDASGKPCSIEGNFTLTYGGIFDLASQAGNMHGILKANSDVLAVNGEVKPYVFKGEWLYPPNPAIGFFGVPLLELTVNGHWSGIRGIQGNGDFTAWLKFIPTADGHVASIMDSNFLMQGDFQFDQDHQSR